MKYDSLLFYYLQENYVKGLEEIIKRDYFPDLLRQEKLQEYFNSALTPGRLPTVLREQTPYEERETDPIRKFIERKTKEKE